MKRVAKKNKSPLPLYAKGVFRPELLAPAGNLEKMKTAFAFGADAVYAGIPDFSLRTRINDFTLGGLKEAIEYAHKKKKKIYITANIIAHNKHLEKLPPYIKFLKKYKPDGFIVSDPGVIAVIKKIWPQAEIHLSTQANCVNWQTAKFWFDHGLKRVVLGRETTFAEIQEIRKKVPKLELETFIHGAMCMAYSGRCFLSKFLADRSGNLGDCAQPCRWKYKTINNYQLAINNTEGLVIRPEGRDEKLELVEEEHGSYILNSQDMCLIKRLPELMKAGIDSFKIEGRAKSVYYLACVVGAYRRAIDLSHNAQRITRNKLKIELSKLYKELDEKLFHRGYTEGFMFEKGKMAQNLENSHKYPNWEFCGQVVAHNAQPCLPAGRRATHNAKNKYQIYIKVHNSLKVGDQIEIVAPGYDIIKMKLKKMADAETGEEVTEAHGGQKKIVIIEVSEEIPEYSVVRRKLIA